MTQVNTLQAAAKERAVRSFFQGLAIDVLVAIAMFIQTNIDNVSDKTALILVLVTLAKTVVQTVAAYLLRYFAAPKAEVAATRPDLYEVPESDYTWHGDPIPDNASTDAGDPVTAEDAGPGND